MTTILLERAKGFALLTAILFVGSCGGPKIEPGVAVLTDIHGNVILYSFEMEAAVVYAMSAETPRAWRASLDGRSPGIDVEEEGRYSLVRETVQVVSAGNPAKTAKSSLTDIEFVANEWDVSADNLDMVRSRVGITVARE